MYVLHHRLKTLDMSWLLKLAAIVSSLSLFLFQTIGSIHIYLNRRKILTSKFQDSEEFTFPRITVCPDLPFNPKKMTELGLEIPVNSAYYLSRRVWTLQGIDVNLSIRELQEFAGLPLGSLLEEVQVGDEKEVYDISSTFSNLWSPSFKFMTPCFTLKPMTLKGNLSTIFIKGRKGLGFEPCIWYEDGIMKQYYNNLDCPFINEHCNNSCSEEKLFTSTGVDILLESTTEDDYESHMVPLDYSIQSSSRFPSDYIMELEPYTVSLIIDQDYDYEVQTCFRNCLFEALPKEHNCFPFDFINHDYSVSNVCRNGHVGEYVMLKWYDCPKKCPPKSVDNYWKIRKVGKSSGGLLLCRGGIEVEHIEEYETYPLEKLLADIGGNLGLLLGISLFSISIDLCNFFINICNKVEGLSVITKWSSPDFKRHIKTIFQYMAGSIILLFTILNLTALLQSYIYQVEHLTASIINLDYRSSTLDIPETITLQDWVYGYFASHSLGCRVIPPDQLTKCLQKCVLEKMVHRHEYLLPYMLVDNLLPCSDIDAHFPYIRYAIPFESVVKISEKDENICSTQCEPSSNLGNLYFTDYPTPKVMYTQAMSEVQLICNIGGIIGLYFGFSFLDIHELAISPALSKFKKGKTLSAFFRLLFICTAGFLGASICLQQVYIFLFMHPVFTSTSINSLTVPMLPAISLCPWPPVLNLSKMTQKGINGNDTRAILHQYLQIHTNNISNMSQVWEKIWSLNSDFYCSDYGQEENLGQNDLEEKTFASFFGKCFTCIPKPTVDDFKSQKKDYCIKMKGLGSKSLLFQIHDQRVSPFWNGIEFEDRVMFYDFTHITVRSLYHFITTSGKGVQYGDCMTLCFLGKISDNDQCKFTGTDHEDVSCYHSELFSEIVVNTTQMLLTSQNPLNVITSSYIAECDRHCKNSEFLSLKAEVQSSPFSHSEHRSKSALQGIIKWTSGNEAGVCAHILTDKTEEREESFAYSATQLLSDIGGVASFTIGISLLTLLFKILRKLDEKCTK